MKRFGTLLRAAASVALIGALVWWAGPEGVVAQFRAAAPAGIALLILLHVADRVLMAYKWWRLLRARGHAVELGDAVRGYFLGSFVGAVLPIAGGADVSRIGALRGRGVRTEGLISSVALERALGAISHGVFCLISIGLAVALQIELEVSAAALALVAVALVATLTATLPLSFTLARIAADRLREGAGFRARLAHMAEDYAGWRAHPRELWVFLVLTLVEGFYPIGAYWVAARALQIEASLVVMAIVVPIAFLLPRLPIPLPSLGPEQFGFVYLALLLGIAQDEATAVTLLFLGTLLLALAPGAVAWLNARPSELPET